MPWPVAALDAEEARAARHRPDARAHLRVGGPEPAVDRRPSDEPSRLLARPEQPGGGGRVEARDLVRNGRKGREPDEWLADDDRDARARVRRAQRTQCRHRKQEVAERAGKDERDRFN